MQNKGIFVLLATLLSIACLYVLSFTYFTNKVAKNAKEYANGDLEKEAVYLDSMENEKVYPLFGYTYSECKDRELNLGLDLKGGMNVTMEVEVAEVLKALSQQSKDENFQQAIKEAKEAQKQGGDDFITVFYKKFQEIAPDASLASSDIFGLGLKTQGVNENTSNEDVIKILREEADAVIENTFNVLRTRIDKFGVSQPSITKADISGRIVIELPGVKDPERVRKLLQGAANLEFWEVHDSNEIYSTLFEADAKLRSLLTPLDTVKVETEDELAANLEEQDAVGSPADSLGVEIDTTNLGLDNLLNEEERKKQNPLVSLLNLSKYSPRQGGIAAVKPEDVAKVEEYLAMPQIKSMFGKNVTFLWSGQADSTLYDLYAIKTNTIDGAAPLTGEVMVDAKQEFDMLNGRQQPSISMTMNNEGAKKWAKLTRKVAETHAGKPNKGQIAIVLDDLVYSAPSVKEEINSRTSQITGAFTIEEAKDLATKLKSGKLPVPALIVSEEIVGPSLGKEQIRSGMYSFGIAFLIVLLYMLFFYSKGAGLVANIALLANLFFVFGVLVSFGAVLTLPGIAGIVLTIGMSVDANVLIYERITEELKAGKHMKTAVADGYKNALSAIIDGNLTTFLTGAILFVFGSGPIKGFATTLMIGIVTSLFAAIFITRLVIEWRLSKDKDVTFSTKFTQAWLTHTRVDFLSKRKVAYIVSSILILISIGSLATKGLNLGIDFIGGRTYIVKFDEKVSTEDLLISLGNVYGTQPEVKTYGGDNQVKITTKYKIEEDGADIDHEVETLLYEGVKHKLKEGTTQEAFLENNRVMSQKVGPTIADDIKRDAFIATFFALLVIFFYILVRFRNWQYGLGALAALAHDSLIVLGIFSLAYGILPFSLEIDQAFIAAILTVVGYSINDTVVVFDRIREFVGLAPKADRKDVVNKALNSTLRRTFSTSLSTLVVLLAIFFFGGASIQGFIFALIIGVLVGTYSSIFIASPIAYDTALRAEKRKK